MKRAESEIEGLFIIYCAAMRVKRMPAWAEPAHEWVAAWRVASDHGAYRIEELHDAGGRFLMPFGDEWRGYDEMWGLLRFAVDSMRERDAIAGGCREAKQ